jgi:protein SCO1/2
MEASSGLVRPSIAKALRFCLSYDPKRKQYGFDVLRVGGTVVIALTAGLALYLVFGGKKRKRRPGREG